MVRGLDFLVNEETDDRCDERSDAANCGTDDQKYCFHVNALHFLVSISRAPRARFSAC